MMIIRGRCATFARYPFIFIIVIRTGNGEPRLGPCAVIPMIRRRWGSLGKESRNLVAVGAGHPRRAFSVGMVGLSEEAIV